MIILDTSFLVAYKIENDEHYKKAIKIMNELVKGKYGNPVISDYIFDEIVTVIFSRSKKLSTGVEIGEELRNSIEIIKIEGLSFEEGWKLFKNQKDTKFSFTDCTTLALMKKKDITNIATFDEDFKKMEWINVIS